MKKPQQQKGNSFTKKKAPAIEWNSIRRGLFLWKWKNNYAF